MWDITFLGSVSTGKHDFYHSHDSTWPIYDYEKDTHPFDYERILVVGNKEFGGYNADIPYEQRLEWLKIGYIYGRIINPQILFMPSRDSGIKEVLFSHYDTTTDDNTDHAAIIVYEGTITASAVKVVPSKRVGGKTAYPGHDGPWEDRSDILFFGLGLKRPRK